MTSQQLTRVEELTQKLNELEQKNRKLMIDIQNEKMAYRSKDRKIANYSGSGMFFQLI